MSPRAFKTGLRAPAWSRAASQAIAKNCAVAWSKVIIRRIPRISPRRLRLCGRFFRLEVGEEFFEVFDAERA